MTLANSRWLPGYAADRIKPAIGLLIEFRE
jgi:hypothetical protein